MNYFNFYPGDYQRDTADLTLAEHGAFVLILMHYYATETPPPADMSALWRICRATTDDERDSVERIANRFFPLLRGERRNLRADREIAKARPRISAARANGGRGGRKKNPVGNPAANPVGKPAGTPVAYPEQTQSGTQRTTHAGVGVGVGVGARSRAPQQEEPLGYVGESDAWN